MELWPSLAGWRGLREPSVAEHFGGTLYSFADDWGTCSISLVLSRSQRIGGFGVLSLVAGGCRACIRLPYVYNICSRSIEAIGKDTPSNRC